MGGIDHESECWNQRYRYVAGVDEVGMGCLAGPVVAAAVVFASASAIPAGINDSKLLSSKKRAELDIRIRESALAFAVA